MATAVAMDRTTLLKTKPLPAEDSEEEETDSSDEEETEDEEQAEELSAYESDSDESTDATKKRQQGAANGKQRVLICADPLARMLIKTSYSDMFRYMWTRFLGSCWLLLSM